MPFENFLKIECIFHDEHTMYKAYTDEMLEKFWWRKMSFLVVVNSSHQWNFSFAFSVVSVKNFHKIVGMVKDTLVKATRIKLKISCSSGFDQKCG